MKVKKFFTILLICLAVFAAVWCIIHRRVIYAWIKHEPMPELPEWHKKCMRWFFGKVGEGAVFCVGKAINKPKKVREGA